LFSAEVDVMSDESDRKPTLSATGQRAAERRRLRLAAALRDNLRKRKAQERVRSGAARVPADGAGEGGKE
jgi:hypothetical protein